MSSGKLVQNQLATTDYVIGASDKVCINQTKWRFESDRKHALFPCSLFQGFRARNMRQNGTHDLTSYKWLLRCEKEVRLVAIA